MRVLAQCCLLAALALTPTSCLLYAPTTLGAPALAGMKEFTLAPAEDYWTDEKIAVVPIEGTIGSRRSVANLKEQLDAIAEDDEVKAVILRINSPGGGVTASDQMHQELLDFKRRTQLPMIAAMTDVAASGGYYVAVAADEIMAHPTTVTGSIGVIAEMVSLEGLFDMAGLQQRTFTSGPHKDMGSPFRPMTDEERALFQHIIDSHYERFLAVVDEGRSGLDRDAVRTLADGRIYTAEQARDSGLIDSIGYLEDAVEWAREAAGIPDAEVVTWRVGWGFRSNIYGASTEQLEPRAERSALLDLGLDRLLPEPGVHFLYMWKP